MKEKTIHDLKALAAGIVEDVTALANAIKAQVPELPDEVATQFALEIMAKAGDYAVAE